MNKSQKNKTKGSSSIKLIVTIIVVVGFLVLFFLWLKIDSKTLTLKDVNVMSCDQLPTLSTLDTLFLNNRSHLAEMLESLSSCTNNSFTCKNGWPCKEENYSNRLLRMGNTVIEWQKVSECGNKNKAAILISYSSACEGTIVNQFLQNSLDLHSIPIHYENY